MAAQTSPDAHVPVFFALMKLETVHLLQDILFFNVSLSHIGPESLSPVSNSWVVGWKEMMVLNGMGGLDLFLTECLLPAVHNEMEMDKIGQQPWTTLGFIYDWPNCCCADLLAQKSLWVVSGSWENLLLGNSSLQVVLTK